MSNRSHSDSISHSDSMLDDEIERYELREPPRYRFEANRREFSQLVGAGVVVAVGATKLQAQRPRSRQTEFLNQRFHLGTDGVVSVLSSKVEVGQGSRTQIAQATAEELELPIERVKVVLADTELCPNDGGTAGSRTTPSTVPRVRNASSALRRILIELAAEKWKVDVGQVEYQRGVCKSRDRQLSMNDFATNESLQQRLAESSPDSDESVREVETWESLGQSAAQSRR